MFTIDKEMTNEIVIDKSSFITYIKPVDNVDDAKAYLNALKEKHPDATHHVSAYMIGKTGENGHFTDDGEPSGTAGMPVFDVLRKNELTNVVIDVVRYFGGIKLGAGGLVRAYSKSASQILKLVNIVPIIEYTTFKVIFDYSYLKLIERNLTDCEIINKFYEQSITLIIKTPTSNYDKLCDIIKNLTQNEAKISILD